MDDRLKVDPLTLLKKTEAELREREIQLSKINAEVYKKNLELVKEKRRLEAILYNMAEAVFVLDSSRRFTLFNNRAQQLFDYPETDVLGKDCDAVIHVADEKGTPLSSLDFLMTGTANASGIKEREFLVKTKLGIRIIKINVSEINIPYEEKLEYVVLMNDITAEKEVGKLKDEFISIVSHELRTPMTAIKGNLWMISTGRSGELPEKAKNYLAKAIRGTDRMIALIADILNASSIEQGRIDLRPETIDLKSLIVEELEELKARAEQKGLVLELAGFEGVPPVRGDRRRILEVLVNLVGNSIKYTDAGFVKVSGQKEGQRVRIRVTDSGKGFDREDADKLFSKFGRLSSSYVTVAEASGTGLGLYISRMLIEKMGGEIGAESPGAGRGSTFWFTLPVAA